MKLIASQNGWGKWHKVGGCGKGDGIVVDLKQFIKDRRFNHSKLCKICFSKTERRLISHFTREMDKERWGEYFLYEEDEVKSKKFWNYFEARDIYHYWKYEDRYKDGKYLITFDYLTYCVNRERIFAGSKFLERVKSFQELLTLLERKRKGEEIRIELWFWHDGILGVWINTISIKKVYGINKEKGIICVELKKTH